MPGSVQYCRSILSLAVFMIGSALLFFYGHAIADTAHKDLRPAHVAETVSMTVKEVLKAHNDELMALPGVMGTARGLCEQSPCIKVYVIEKTPQLEQQIDAILKEFPYRIEETGKFRPHS